MEFAKFLKIAFLTILVSPQLFGMGWIDDTLHFMWGGLKNFGAVGTIFPLSRYMASTIIEHVKKTSKRSLSKVIRIAEMGAGNGALTEYFVQWIDQQMHDTGRSYVLDLVELDPDFCEILQQKFKDYSWISVHCGDAATYTSEQPYDVLVSTLPFNSHFFSADSVTDILRNFETLLKDRGMFMYVEYAVCGAINKKLLLSKEQQEIFTQKHALLNEFKKKHKAQSQLVFRNVPPTHLYFMHITK